MHGGQYNTTENFITSNLYSCVELNAHNLVALVVYLRNRNKPELFVPVLYNSQPCEESFRQMRSMGTINYTKINFSLLDLFHLVGRIELQKDIVYSKLSAYDISFPRNKKYITGLCHFQLPSDDVIKFTMQRAKQDAIKDALSMGMNVDIDEISSPQMKRTEPKSNKSNNENDKSEMNDVDGENEDDEHELINDSLVDCSNLRDYGHADNTNNAGAFVTVSNKDGTMKVVRKSTLIWLLNDSNEGLSNDRLKRVQNSNGKKSSSRQLCFKRKTPQSVSTNDEIQIGEWCVFKNDNENISSSKFIIGEVLGYQYIIGNNPKEKQYTWDFALTKSAPQIKTKRGINVLAVWFAYEGNGELKRIPNVSCYYTNIENYVVTVPDPSFQSAITTGKEILFDPAFAQIVDKELLSLECEPE